MPAQSAIFNQTPIIQAQYFSLEEGLSHRHVTSIHQDSAGFLWFGSKYGLNRFDGYGFKWFTEEKNGLQSNEIDQILADAKGRLWLFHTGNIWQGEVITIDLFDPVTHLVQSFKEAFGETARFDQSDIICFTKNKQGHLAFLTKSHLIVHTDRFVYYPISEPDIRLARKIYWADDGRFWVVVVKRLERTKLLILDSEGTVEHEILEEKNAEPVIRDLDEHGGGQYSTSIRAGASGQTQRKHYKIDPSGNKSEDLAAERFFGAYDIKQGFLSAILEKIQSYYWVSTEEREFKLLPENGGRPILLSEQYPSLKFPTSILADHEGAIWVATEFGVYRFMLKKPRFKVFLHDRKVPLTDETFSIRGMAVVDDGADSYLWAMVEQLGLLWRVDLRTGEEREIMGRDGARWALGKTKQNEILCAGTRDMLKIKGKTGEVVHSYHFEKPADALAIWMNVEDKYGKIWSDNYEAGKLIFFNEGKQTNLENWTGDPGTIYTYQFAEDKTDTAWVATSKGLFRLNIQNGQVVARYWKEGKGKFHLPFDHVHHFIQAENGTFWLATATGGLVNWSPNQGIIERLTRVDGLPNNTIYAVYPDEHGNFWMPTDYGIAILNRSTRSIRTYTVNDGLSNNEFNRISHCRDEAGNFYFGTLNGVTAFHPDDFVADTTAYHPPLVITSFHQFDAASNQLVDKTADLLRSNTIVMRPGDNLFRLEFSLLAFQDMKNVQYSYRLEGVDGEWNYQNVNTIRLSRLPYGNYVLAIRGQTAEGLWSNHMLHINVQVVKPFYLQAWFIVLAFASVLGGIFYYYKQRERGLKERQAELERVVRERTATIEHQKEELQSLDAAKSHFFANISHELRTPLTLMLGPIKSLLKGNHPPEQQEKLLNIAKQSGQQLQQLINEILDLRKLEMGKMEVHAEPTLLTTFFNRHASQFESLAKSKQIDFSHETTMPEDAVANIDQDKFRQILYNLLSNALKFTPAGGRVSVNCSLHGNSLNLKVADSGSGIPPEDLPHVFDRFFQSSRPGKPAEGGTGIGLALCQEYAKLFGGSISVDSTVEKGSVFSIEFPVTLADARQLQPAGITPEAIETDAIPQASVVAKSAPAPEELTSKTTILLVEDNPELQDYIRLILEEKYHVITAGNGQEALDSQLTANCQLIISDLMMPVMDGYQLLEILKSDDATRHIPVIMLTARAEAKDRLKALRIGVDDYLTKPFDEEELLVRIENLLANHAVRRAAADEMRAAGEATDISQPDKDWLENFETYLQRNIANDVLTVPFLAQEFAMSESTLLRQLKRLTGLSPQKYWMEMRLNEARQMLENRQFDSITMVASKVGYPDARSFSRAFKERFGKLPSEILND
ncbi:MAG: response regulator [Lewinellaceae bacterium]|nr:response regulator [Lewinellaceae bacterium]